MTATSPNTTTAGTASSPVRFDKHRWHTHGASVSPDGHAFAYIVDDGSGYPRAAQRSLAPDTIGPLRWVRVPASGPVRTLIHSTDGRWLAVEIAPSGGEHHQVWVVTTDPDDPTSRRIAATATDGRTFGTVSLIGWDSDWVLLTATATDGTAHALRVHPHTGATEILDVRVGAALIDSWKGASLLRVGPRGYRDLLLVRTTPTDGLTDRPHGPTITPLLPSDPGSVTDHGIILDQGYDHPSLVFVGPPRDHRRDLDSVQALVASDFDAKYPRLLGVEVGRDGTRFRVLAQRPDAGLDDFVVSNDQSHVALLWNVGGYSELQVMTLPDQTLHDPIPLPGAVASDLSISAAGTLVALTVSSAGQPPLVHLVNTATGRVHPVLDDDHDASGGYAAEDSGPSQLLVPELHEFSARDGMPLSGLLFRAKRDHSTDRPGPCLVYFHGGPEAQTRPDYHFMFGPLVAAGISVFAPNVRGSSGYGRMFSHADDRYGRYAGINDAADCASYLTDTGLADPHAVFCAGRSYGGYLTLACVTFHPTLFAAGIAICGMSDLESFFANTEPWIAVAAYTKYGHPQSDRELLRDLSPIHRIDEVSVPLLVVHGAHDTNVPVSESQQIVDELQARGAIATLLMFDDEGHEIVKRENQQRLTQAVADWVRRYRPTDPMTRRSI